MRRFFLAFAWVTMAATGAWTGAQAEPYALIRAAEVGGDGGWDYVYADAEGRRLYVPRSGETPRISVFDLDTLDRLGEIPGVDAHGVAVDPASSHGFATSSPVAMWNTQTLAAIKTIDVQGAPDGILFDPFDAHVYILSHTEPNVTVIDAKGGSVLGTIDIGGAPEQAASDGKGHVYIDVENKDQVAVVDAATMIVTGRYDLGGKGGTPAGLAIDSRNGILFVACRKPATMVMLDAGDGKILDALPIGAGVDGAVFNPATMEAFSSQGDGTLTVIKETSPTAFAVEQTVRTHPGARTLTLDAKTNRVLLIAADYAPAPEGAPPGPGGRPARGPMIPGSFAILMVGR